MNSSTCIRSRIFGMALFGLAGFFPFCAIAQTSESKPQSIDTVRVHEKREVDYSAANPTKYQLFMERKARGVGTFLTRDKIESMNTTRTQTLLGSIAGIKVRQHGTEWTIQSQRCSGGTIPGSAQSTDAQPMVFIDGHRIGRTDELDLLRPAEIEAVEVYQGASQLPAEARGRGCFAIFLWTRTP